MMQPSEVVVKTEESAGEDTQPSRKRRKGSSEVDDFGISRKQQKQREAKLKIQKIRARAEAKAQAERRRQEQDRQREDERNLKIYQARVEKELMWKKQHAKPNMPWRSGQSLHLFDLPAEILEQVLALDQDLSIKDYMNVSATCWYLRLPFLDDILWREIYLSRKKRPVVTDHFGCLATITSVPVPEMSLPFLVNARVVTIPAATECQFNELARREPRIERAVRLTGHGQNKPIIDSREERQTELLSQINTYAQYTSAGKLLARSRYLDEGLSPKSQKECQALLRCFTSRLPLSRTEAEHFGMTAHRLNLNIRPFKYGPWQTLAIRSVNFPIIHVNDAVRKHWLSPEDLASIKQVPKGCHPEALSNGNDQNGWYFMEDIEELSQDLSDLIAIRKESRDEVMACLEIEAGRKTPRESCCAVCWFPHAVTFPIKHRWWYTFPEYSAIQVQDIEARIYRLNEKPFECPCGMNCDEDDYDNIDACTNTYGW